MKTNRRQMLQAVLAGGAATLTSCERTTALLAQQLGQTVPPELPRTDAEEIDPDFHLLSRAAFGPWPGELARLKRQGREAWIEEQLRPETIDDSACDLRAEWFESLYMEAGNAYEFQKEVLRDELTRHAVLRAVYSKRQLFESMVEFWGDHLNIDLEKTDCIYLRPSDDRDVVRKHALGQFRDLILASAKSPAMLTYLDGRDNKVTKEKPVPNENYARELMELHTLGVSGGYTQKDIYEAARCLSGWTVDLKMTVTAALNPFQAQRGTAYFKKQWHDQGEKRVLGHVIPAGGGERDLERLVDIVCAHPSTAHYIALKLCRRFVAHEPPEGLVQKVAAEFTRTQGSIKDVLRVLFRSDEFAQSRGLLLKRPFRFLVSALRAVAADVESSYVGRKDNPPRMAAEALTGKPASIPLVAYMHPLGQPLFRHPTPDGYPDEETPWLGTLLWRWNFSFALAGGFVPDVRFDGQALRKALHLAKDEPQAKAARLFSHCIGRKPTPTELAALEAVSSNEDLLGLVLASPAFQRC
ncbi:MAG: DUF1800 domain-containing protein [Roseimicrobium sp.]